MVIPAFAIVEGEPAKIIDYVSESVASSVPDAAMLQYERTMPKELLDEEDFETM